MNLQIINTSVVVWIVAAQPSVVKIYFSLVKGLTFVDAAKLSVKWSRIYETTIFILAFVYFK